MAEWSDLVTGDPGNSTSYPVLSSCAFLVISERQNITCMQPESFINLYFIEFMSRGKRGGSTGKAAVIHSSCQYN